MLVVRVTYSTGRRHTHDASDADTEQRAQALEKAAAARSHRARIKSELKSGSSSSEFFTASETDDVLGKMKVRALPISPPRVGPQQLMPSSLTCISPSRGECVLERTAALGALRLGRPLRTLGRADGSR